MSDKNSATIKVLDRKVTFERGTGNKKYKATFTNPITNRTNTVLFGDKRYDQWKDQTPLKLYSDRDHNDEKRKKRYYQRHGKDNELWSPGWFSAMYLW